MQMPSSSCNDQLTVCGSQPTIFILGFKRGTGSELTVSFAPSLLHKAVIQKTCFLYFLFCLCLLLLFHLVKISTTFHILCASTHMKLYPILYYILYPFILMKFWFTLILKTFLFYFYFIYTYILNCIIYQIVSMVE